MFCAHVIRRDQQRSDRMNRRATATLIVAAVCLGGTGAHAGPCTQAIAKFEQAVRESAGKPDAGPQARQTIGAQLHHEPTPASVERAEARAQAAFDATLARAKRRDARGDRAGCMRALTKAEDMYNLQ
jgi:hypothetical protein